MQRVKQRSSSTHYSLVFGPVSDEPRSSRQTAFDQAAFSPALSSALQDWAASRIFKGSFKGRYVPVSGTLHSPSQAFLAAPEVQKGEEIYTSTIVGYDTYTDQHSADQ